MKRRLNILILLLLTLGATAQTSRFTTDLRISNVSVNGSEHPFLQVGDTMRFTITVQNIGSEPFQNCQLFMESNGTVDFLDSTEYFDYIAPSNEYILHECATAVIKNSLTYGSLISFAFHISNDTEEAVFYQSYQVSFPSLTVTDYAIFHHGKITSVLSANEQDSITFLIENRGDFDLYNLSFGANTDQSGITLSGSTHVDTLFAGSTTQHTVSATTTATFPEGSTFDIQIPVILQGQPSAPLITSIIGICHCDDFDDGLFPDDAYGQGNFTGWQIDTTDSYSGQYALRSGTITHNDTSTIHLPIDVPEQTTISFMYKTSSELNYDWLYFFIDGEQMGRWSGFSDWTKATFSISAGAHVLTWSYTKDYSNHHGSDCAWVDHLCLPNYAFAHPSLAITPAELAVTMRQGDTATHNETLIFANPSDIYLLYENSLTDDNGNPINWARIGSLQGSINAQSQREIFVHFRADFIHAGEHRAILRSEVQGTDNVVETPIILTVSENSGIEHRDAPACSIYPNPANDLLTIHCPENHIRNIYIFNTLGERLRVEQADGDQTTVDLRSLAPGLYMVRIETDNGIITQKLIKR